MAIGAESGLGASSPEPDAYDLHALRKKLLSAAFTGGVDLGEIDLRTMQSRLCEGLFFAGEVVDVDGVTGGLNFQNAWTGGHRAGRSIAESAHSAAAAID